MNQPYVVADGVDKTVVVVDRVNQTMVVEKCDQEVVFGTENHVFVGEGVEGAGYLFAGRTQQECEVLQTMPLQRSRNCDIVDR